MPFQPVAGLFGSDLPAASGLKSVVDPYSGREVYAVPRLQPDWALLHVPEADDQGNARIYGTVFWDRIMARAAKGVILSAERIVPQEELARQPELTVVPGLFVKAVVEAPGGADGLSRFDGPRAARLDPHRGGLTGGPCPNTIRPI